jgi:hypothetical protein
MDSGFFEGLKCCCLGVRQARFRASLGEDPSSPASLHQQELDDSGANPITNGRHLLRSSQLAKMRQRHELRRRPKSSHARPAVVQSELASAHSSKSARPICFRIEHNLILPGRVHRFAEKNSREGVVNVHLGRQESAYILAPCIGVKSVSSFGCTQDFRTEHWKISTVCAANERSRPDTNLLPSTCSRRRWESGRGRNRRLSESVFVHSAQSRWLWDPLRRVRSTLPPGR